MGISKEEVKKQYDKMVEQVRIENEKAEELYRLYKAMTPSMQKAVVDIMKTVNGEQIDEKEEIK